METPKSELVRAVEIALAVENGIPVSAMGIRVFADEVVAHRLSLLVLRASKQLNLAPDVAALLERDVQSHLVAAARLVTGTALVSECLTEHAIRHLVIKGAALGALQGGVSARGAGDIDLLIAPGDLNRVHDALKTAGYRPRLAMPPLNHRKSWRLITSLDRETPYVGAGGVQVDVHWRISPQRTLVPGPEELFERAVRVEVGGAQVPTLAPGDALAVAAFHAYFDRFALLRAMVDVSRLIPLASAAALPALSKRLGSLLAGVIELHAELFPSISQADRKLLIEQLPASSPMVRKVWKRYGANPAALNPGQELTTLGRKLTAELAFDNPLEGVLRFIGKRLLYFPPATSSRQNTSITRAFIQQITRLSKGIAS